MAHHTHAPYSGGFYDHELDDSDSVRRINPRANSGVRRRRSSSASSNASISRRARSDDEYASGGEDDVPEDPRMSMLGPKLVHHSPAPWARGDADVLLEDEEEDEDNGLDSLSLFGGNKRGRGMDWKRPFANTQPRSNSATRPSREYGPTSAVSAKDKSNLNGLGIYSNRQASRSAASLSVYSVASGKDVFASIAAPPLPTANVHVNGTGSTGTTPPNSAGPSVQSMRKAPRTRTISAGASARSSVFSAVSSRSQTSSSDVPPMPFPRGFDMVESPHGISHPYANPDLVDSKPSLHRTDTTNSGQDDGSSLFAPSLTYTSGTRSPRSPRSPLAVTGQVSISTPLPAAPGALQGLAKSTAWPSGGATGASYSLISLEQAQALQRAKAANSAANSPATAAFPVSTLPFEMVGDRQRKGSTASVPGVAGYYPPEAPLDGPPANKTVKPRRSGFMKLLRGGSKEEPSPALPPLPPAPTKVISHAHPSRYEPWDAREVGMTIDRRMQDSPSGSDSLPTVSSPIHAAMHSPASSVASRAPASLAVVVTPAASPNPLGKPHRNTAPSHGLTVDIARASPHLNDIPRSAPPGLGAFDAPALHLRPMSTLFSGLPQEFLAPTSQGSTASGSASAAAVSSGAGVDALQATITSLEREMQELRAQMAEMRALAASGVCEKCGGGLTDGPYTPSVSGLSVADSGVAFGSASGTSSSLATLSSVATVSSADIVHSHAPSPSPTRSSYRQDAERTPPGDSTWRAQGVSVLDRPRARVGGRDRTNFAGMWRD